jgi:hypothetical protein
LAVLQSNQPLPFRPKENSVSAQLQPDDFAKVLPDRDDVKLSPGSHTLSPQRNNVIIIMMLINILLALSRQMTIV